MDTFLLDGQPSSFDAHTQLTVAEFLREVVSGLPQHRIVSDVVLDGRRSRTYSSQSHLEAALQKKLSEYVRIECRTVDCHVWAENGLDRCWHAAEPIAQSFLRVAQWLREDSGQNQARHLYVQCLEGLDRFLESIDMTKSAWEYLEQESPSVTLLHRVEEELDSVLRSLIRAQQEKDPTVLADCIEYTVLPSLSQWKSMLRQ